MDRSELLGLVERAVVLPRRIADERAPTNAVSALVVLLLAALRRGEPDAAQAALRLGALPAPLLREAVLAFPQVADATGVETYSPAAGMQFARTPFFEAVQAAFEHGEAHVQDRAGVQRRLRPRPAKEGERAALLVDVDGEERVESDARLLLADPDTPLEEAVRICVMGDTDAREGERLVARLRDRDGIGDRVALLDEFLREGLLQHYVSLLEAFRRRQGVPTDAFMPPHVGRMTGWLRLPQQGEVEFDGVAERLLAETDLATALDRHSALPRPLPQPLLAAFRSLNHLERRRQLKRLLRVVRTPLAMAHALVLAGILFEDQPHREAVLDRLWEQMLRWYAERTPNHLGLTRWVANELARSPVARDWPAATTLAVAWSHANEVLRLSIDTRVSEAFLSSLDGRFHFVEERLYGIPALRWDAAHPWNVQHGPYLLGIAAYVAEHNAAPNIVARAKVLASLMTFGEDERPNGFEPSLLFRNDEREDALGSIFAVSYDTQTDALFGDILNTTLRDWRSARVDERFRWVRLEARHGDCVAKDADDRKQILAEAPRLSEHPIDWTDAGDVARFTVMLHNAVASENSELRTGVERAWDAEVVRASRLAQASDRAVALAVLLRTSVDLAWDSDVATAVSNFAERLSTLRRAFVSETEPIDLVAIAAHPRLPSSAARALEQLVIAARTR
jgi:hypothetical protein